MAGGHVLYARRRKGMRDNKHRSGRLCVELLEDRCLLAGNVTAAVVNGSLIVTGDAESNDVLLVQTAQGIEVHGVVFSGEPPAVTTVNGGESFTAVGLTRDIKVDLGAGNDTLGAAFVAPGDLTVDMGE